LLKLIAPVFIVGLFGLFASSAVSAMPAAPLSGVTLQDGITTVQVRHRGPPPRYVPGRRYHSAPHGWHRYHARPRNWSRRGCVIVGPVWFCP
jgi:hypothetical protein